MDINRTYYFPFASFPAVRLAVLLMTGIVLDLHLDSKPLWWFWFLGICISVYLLCEHLHQQTVKTWIYYSTLIFYLCSVVCFGGLWHALFNTREMPPEAEVIEAYAWQELSFKGEVMRLKATGTNKYHLDIAIDTTFFPNRLSWDKSYNLRVILDPADTPYPENLKLGDCLDFTAVIYPLSEPRNPYQFDYKNHLASKNIFIQAGIQSVEAIRHNSQFFSWNSVRGEVLSAVDGIFSPETSSLAKALLVGYKDELSKETRTAFSRSGLSHIMAVSGLHVGFILAPFWFIIPVFWTFRHGKKAGLLILLSILFLYAGLTEFSASVSRASLTGGLLMYGRLFHKVRNAKNLAAVSALLILLVRPGDLFAIGFQLSFAAVYIILLVAPVITRVLPQWIQYGWYGTPLMAVVISLIVQVGLFPLLGYYFGEFSVIGPLANAFVVPFLGMVVPAALLLLPAALIWPAGARVLNLPIDYFLHILNSFAATVSGWEWSWIQLQIESVMLFVIWATAIFWVASLRIPTLRWKLFAVLLFLLCVNQAQKIISSYPQAKLQLIVFDVGQGDAILLQTPEGRYYLFDTGLWQPGYNSARHIIIPYLRGRGIAKLDGVFLSHPHADHIGGMAELVNTIPIDTIYNSGYPHDSDLFNRYRKAAAGTGIPVKSLQAGQFLVLDTATRLFVYGPGRHTAAAPISNVNNQSLVLELVYGSTEFLFMGDAEQEQEQELLRTYPGLLDTDFLKVAHHGSRTSSTERFLQASSPSFGVISLNFRNRFGHPHEEAVRRLRQYIDHLYFTSLEGAMRLTSDGRHIQVFP